MALRHMVMMFPVSWRMVSAFPSSVASLAASCHAWRRPSSHCRLLQVIYRRRRRPNVTAKGDRKREANERREREREKTTASHIPPSTPLWVLYWGAPRRDVDGGVERGGPLERERNGKNCVIVVNVKLLLLFFVCVFMVYVCECGWLVLYVGCIA